MQLEKAKETKQDMERCRLLAQRIAEELAPATAAVLNAETPALEKALHRAGVDANPFTVAARQADLLVVEDPAWVEMPAQLPGQVLLVFTGSNVAEGWAEELARRGYYRDFRWRSRGRAQQSALYCTVQPATAEMIAGYEKELDLLRDRMVRAERTCGEEAELIARLRREYGLSYLFISHDLSVVKHISNRIGVMYLGKIVELGDYRTIFGDSRHPYTKALLSAIPIPKIGVERKQIILKGDVPSPVNLPGGCRFAGRCPYATDKCRQEEPKLKDVGNTHYVACHYDNLE